MIMLIIFVEKVKKKSAQFRLTSGIAEKIWENCELSNFPFIPCYTRMNGTKWSESAASP